MLGWSGATPPRTRPHGVGRRSYTSTGTWRSGWDLDFMRCPAAKKPAGPEPTMATRRGFSEVPMEAIPAPSLGSGVDEAPALTLSPASGAGGGIARGRAVLGGLVGPHDEVDGGDGVEGPSGPRGLVDVDLGTADLDLEVEHVLLDRRMLHHLLCVVRRILPCNRFVRARRRAVHDLRKLLVLRLGLLFDGRFACRRRRHGRRHAGCRLR